MHLFARGRRALATVGSLTLGAGLAVTTLTPSAATAVPASAGDDRPAPFVAPADPREKALSDALPARLGSLQYTSVFGSSKVTTSTGKKLVASLGAAKQAGQKASWYIALSRGDTEQHAWSFTGPASSFDISKKGAGQLTLSSKQTGGLGKVALKVKPDGQFKSEKCGGEVYAKTRKVVMSGTFFFDTGSKWGKAGSKTKSFTFGITPHAYFSYDVTCPPVEYEDECYDDLSWSTWYGTEKSYTSIGGSRKGTGSSIYASRTTQLAKPEGAYRSDSAWGTGDALELTEAPDESATLEVHGVKGSGDMAAPSADTYSDPCDTGTQHSSYWWDATVTNHATPISIPAQVFGDFTVPDGSEGYMSRAWSD